MSGFSLIDVNTFPLPDQYLAHNWLNDHSTFHGEFTTKAIPFYAMMSKWVAPVLFDDRFRNFSDLQADLD